MVNINNYNKQNTEKEEARKKIVEIKKNISNPLSYKDATSKSHETKEQYGWHTFYHGQFAQDYPSYMSYKKSSEYDINMGFKRKVKLDKFDEKVVSALEKVVGKEFTFMQTRVNKRYNSDEFEDFIYIAIFKNEKGKEGYEELGRKLQSEYLKEIPTIDSKFEAVNIHVSPEKHTRIEKRKEETIKTRTDYNYLIFGVTFHNKNYAKHQKEKKIAKLEKKMKAVEEELDTLKS